MKIKFLLFLFIFVCFLAFPVAKASALYLSTYWYSENGLDIIWQYGFYITADYGADGDKDKYSQVYYRWLDEYWQTSSDRWARSDIIRNIDNLGGFPYAVTWSTACIDPTVKA